MNAAGTRDGVYFLHGDGSGWEAVRVHNGQAVGMTEESMASTHEAARDAWAGMVPSGGDEELSAAAAAAVVKLVHGNDADPCCFVVTRVRD